MISLWHLRLGHQSIFIQHANNTLHIAIFFGTHNTSHIHIFVLGGLPLPFLIGIPVTVAAVPVVPTIAKLAAFSTTLTGRFNDSIADLPAPGLTAAIRPTAAIGFTTASGLTAAPGSTAASGLTAASAPALIDSLLAVFVQQQQFFRSSPLGL